MTVTATSPIEIAAQPPERVVPTGDPLRVCLVSSNLHAVPTRTYGAVEVQMMEQARGLAALGHEVHVVTVGAPDERDHDRSDSIVFHRLGAAAADELRLSLAGLIADQVRFGRRAAALVRELDPDLAHYHARVPCLIAVRGSRPLTDRCPVLYHAHTWKRAAGMRYPAWSLRRAAYTVGSRFDRVVAERCTHVLAISDFVRRRILESTAVRADRVSVVTNVVDTAIFRPRDVPRDPDRILFIGRVAEEKGIDVVIKALPGVLERVPTARLRIVGPTRESTERGGYQRRCEALVAELGLGHHVSFSGMVPNEELPAEIAASRMLVVPSRWEGLGVVVLEGLACGVPVVGSCVGGIPELVEDRVNGRLVPVDDVAGWATAMVDVLEDDALVARAATAGPARVARHHTRDTVRTELDRIYRLAAAPAGARDARADRPRVLLLLTSTAGGAGLQNHLIAKHLSREAFDPTVGFGPGYPLDSAFAALDIPVIELTMSRRIAPWTNARGFLEIRRLLRKGRFDVVCTSCSIAGLIGRVAAALERVPSVVHVLHVYASQPRQNRLRRQLYRWIERALDALTTRYVAVSNASKQYGVETGIMTTDRVEVIHNAVEAVDRPRRDPARVRGELGIDPHAPVVGFVGRCERQKGLPHLLEAATIVRRVRSDVRFVIVGEGPLRPTLESKARELGVADVVHFTGWRDDVPDLLGALDIFCLPSLWESFGLVLAEAMDASLPVVASNVDGIPEVVADGETGLLVAPGDADALAGALGHLVSNPDVARRLGEAGRRRLSERFSVKSMVRGYETLFEALVTAARKGESP